MDDMEEYVEDYTEEPEFEENGEEYPETGEFENDGTGGEDDYGNDDNYGGGYMDHEENENGEKEQNPLAMSKNSSILEYQEKLITKVMKTLEIPKSLSRAFLNTCKWNTETVLERYSEDPANLFHDCGLKYSEGDKEKAEAPKGVYECSLCLEDTSDYLQNPGCGHYFCKDCWGLGLSTEILGGNVFKLKCFYRGCTELVPDEIVKKVIDEQTWEKYIQYLSSKFVDQSSDMRWCIAPGCTNAITQASFEGNLRVGKCPCGIVFCWNKECASVAHCPASCEDYRKWQEKAGSSDFQSQKWILENTKKCTKCRCPVSKQDGCFQMTCRPPCSQQFCWLCGDDWKTHSDHFRCKNHPEAGTPSDVGNRVLYLTDIKWEGDELFVKLLDRYNFYVKSQKEAKEAQPKIDSEIEKLVQSKLLLNAKPLETARLTLEECRRIVQGMITVRAVNINTDKQSMQAHQVKLFEEQIQNLSNKCEKDILALPKDFPMVQKFIEEVQKSNKILSNLAQNILSQGL